MNDALLQRAVEALSAARQIYVYSPGPCAGLAELMAYRMARFGITIKRMAPSGHELLETLMHAGKKDVVLVFGFVQLLPETEVILDYAREAGYVVILITDRLVFPVPMMPISCCTRDAAKYGSFTPWLARPTLSRI